MPVVTCVGFLRPGAVSCVVAGLCWLNACATTLQSHTPPTTASNDFLSFEELSADAGTVANVYSAVQRVRPRFLAAGSGSKAPFGSASRIHVFINGRFAGGDAVLKAIPLWRVESIRWVQATASDIQDIRINAGDGVLLVRIR